MTIEEAFAGAVEVAARQMPKRSNAALVADDIVRAFLASMEERGVVLAPKEATAVMWHDGASSLDHPSVYMGGPSRGSRERALRCYRAMLASRPVLEVE